MPDRTPDVAVVLADLEELDGEHSILRAITDHIDIGDKP